MKVLVVNARGLHVAHVGCYGNEWVETPALDRLAAEAIVFDQHFSDWPDSLGAWRAWQTGCYGLPVLEDQTPSIARQSANLFEILHDTRVGRGLIYGPRPVEFSGTTWDHAFSFPEPGLADHPAWQVLDMFKNRSHSLTWIELTTLLPPWNIPQAFREQYFDSEDERFLENPPLGSVESSDDNLLRTIQQSYAGAISYLDSHISRIREELEKRDLWDDLLIILTTDAGFGLGEHGVIGETQLRLHEENIHLPLIIRLPGAAEAGRRIAALTQPVDLMPTLLSAFGIPLPEVHGHDLFPLMRGRKEQVRPYACGGWQKGDAAEFYLRTPEWAFFLPMSRTSTERAEEPRLHVKPEDRWEVNELHQHYFEFCKQLQRTLRGFVKASRQAGRLCHQV